MGIIFKIEFIDSYTIHSSPTSRDYTDIETIFKLYRELSTDTLFLEHNGNLVQMVDPGTGKPLTYTVWKAKYTK